MIDQAQELLTVAARTDRKAVNAGLRNSDCLLWALVPLYLLRKTHGPIGISGGDVARFWLRRGIHRSRNTVVHQYRWWIGYAAHLPDRTTGVRGWVITPNGVRYVEVAIASKAVRRGF